MIKLKAHFTLFIILTWDAFIMRNTTQMKYTIYPIVMKYVPTCDTGRGKSMTQKFHSFESRNAIKAQILYFALITQKIHAKFHVSWQGFFNMDGFCWAASQSDAMFENLC